MHCIKKIVYKNTLYIYDVKDVKKMFWGAIDLVFNHANASIKSIALLIPRNLPY